MLEKWDRAEKSCPQSWLILELCLRGVDSQQPRIRLIELNRDISCHSRQGKQNLEFRVSQVSWPAKSEQDNNNNTTWRNITESRGSIAFHSLWSGNDTKLLDMEKQNNMTYTQAKTIFGYPPLDDLFVVFSRQRFYSSYYNCIQVPIGKYSHSE